MSVSKETFLIVGCDIKDRLTDKFEDWYWSEEGENGIALQQKVIYKLLMMACVVSIYI